MTTRHAGSDGFAPLGPFGDPTGEPLRRQRPLVIYAEPGTAAWGAATVHGTPRFLPRRAAAGGSAAERAATTPAVAAVPFACAYGSLCCAAQRGDGGLPFVECVGCATFYVPADSDDGGGDDGGGDSDTARSALRSWSATRASGSSTSRKRKSSRRSTDAATSS